MSWTVKDFKEAIEKAGVSDDAVIHIQINSHEIEQVTTIVNMERQELYPALVLSPFVRQSDHFERIDGKIVDKRSRE